MEKIYTLRKDDAKKDFKIKYGEELNAQQLDVVKNGDGAALVLAGPGSGKTRVLVYRVAYLLESGVNPENILLLTFTNKAAKNMLSRIEELLGYYPKGLMGGTFHHIGNTILRKHADLVGFDKNFSIIDNEDSIQLVKDIIANAIPKRDKHFPSPNVIFSIIGFSKNSAAPVADCIKSKYENFSKFANEIKKIGEIYENRKRKAGMMDFDDLLSNWEKLLDNEQIREKYASQFKYILVDEFQDTNKLQFAIIKKLSGEGNNTMVVGDDCQSIYSFRAAEVRNILDFPEHYGKQGKNKFREFRLETNYRSTPEIMNLVNESIKHNKSQFEKTLTAANKKGSLPIIVRCKDSKQEAEFVCQRILELRDEGVPYGEIGVLFRADYQSVQMELELAKKGIPFIKRGGLKFFEQAHVKDITSVLKIFNNAKDELAWKRVLCLFEGVGQITAGKIWEQLSKSENPLEALKSGSIHNTKMPKGFAQLRGIAKRITIKFPSEIINIFFEEFYRDYLQEKYPNARDRMLDVKQFINLADQYQNISNFLDDIILDADIGRGDKDDGEEEKLMLSTIHQAKGLEWKAVFVISVAEDRFPLSRACADGTLEEERRLFYVACSRCKKELYLTVPMEDFTFWGGNQILKDSIFVQELPENCREEWGIREEMQDEAE
ncbi:MAG: ATP-dependent helicase [Candidatus Aenigmatarchaeota archaeon]